MRLRVKIKSKWVLNHEHEHPRSPSASLFTWLEFFSLFPLLEIENTPQGRFVVLENIQTALAKQVNAMPVSEFQHYVASQDSCFEGYDIEL